MQIINDFLLLQKFYLKKNYKETNATQINTHTHIKQVYQTNITYKNNFLLI